MVGRKLENGFDKKKEEEKNVCINYSGKQIKGFESMDLLSKQAGKKEQAHEDSVLLH